MPSASQLLRVVGTLLDFGGCGGEVLGFVRSIVV